MNKKVVFLFLILFFLLITEKSYCQKNENKIAKDIISNDSSFNCQIDSLRMLKEYAKIIDLYNKKIALDSNENYYIYKSACYYALSGDTIESIQRILLTYKKIKNVTLKKNKYNIYPEDVITESDFNILHCTTGWKQIIDTLINDYINCDTLICNKELSIELWFMGIEDQRNRTWFKNNKADSPISSCYYYQKYAELSDEKSRLNRLEDIIKKYGWPNYSLVGKKAGYAAFFVIQHSAPKTIKKYLPLLNDAAINNEIDKEAYALMLDRHLMNCGKKQIYGTQLFSNQYILWPIEDEKNLNNRRSEMGMTNIEEYLKYFHLEYHYIPENENRTINEILKDYGYYMKKFKGYYYVNKNQGK